MIFAIGYFLVETKSMQKQNLYRSHSKSDIHHTFLMKKKSDIPDFIDSSTSGNRLVVTPSASCLSWYTSKPSSSWRYALPHQSTSRYASFR